MHPNYEIELDHIRDRATSDVRAGSREPAAVPRTHSSLHLPVGTVVRLVGGGKYAGLTGTIQSRGRTRYKIRTSQGLLVAPFALVRRVQGD